MTFVGGPVHGKEWTFGPAHVPPAVISLHEQTTLISVRDDRGMAWQGREHSQRRALYFLSGNEYRTEDGKPWD